MDDAEEAFFATVRAQFPRLQGDWVYCDSAATTHKPQCVLDAMTHFYAHEYATVHRAAYGAAQHASSLYEAARATVAQFIHARDVAEVVFTRGATDSINIVADILACQLLNAQSTIVITGMEHHANSIPWQLAAQRSGAQLYVLPVSADGEICWDSLDAVLATGSVRIVAITHGSNVLGTITPVAAIVERVHAVHGLVLVDGAQTIGHGSIDVQQLGCDFFCFSAHKLYGPTGIGVLWGRKELLNQLNPTRGGGDMVERTEVFSSVWKPAPYRFEPGTPPIVEALGLQEALLFLQQIGMERIASWEQCLINKFLQGLEGLPSVRRIGRAHQRCPLQSFCVAAIHPLDIATFLDMKGVAVRSGKMCCHPLLKALGEQEIDRVSFAMYNSMDDVTRCLAALEEALDFFL